MNIQGRIALVTGAAAGIGRVCARALAVAGAEVMVVDIDAEGGQETVRSIEAAGGRAHFTEADVSTPDGIRAMFKATLDRFGRIDIVHNNAGVLCLPPLWPAPSLEQILGTITTNLAGPIMGTRAAIDAMARGGGVVITTGSVFALMPSPFDPVYIATKAGIMLFTQSCGGLRESHNVRVNSLLVGFVNTGMTAALTNANVSPEVKAALAQALETMPPIEPEIVAAALIDMIEDDSLAGETRTVSAFAA